MYVEVFREWPCIVLPDFGRMVIGNVLPGDSYHSCLSETGTLMACGDGCLKFSGEGYGWLRLCRPEVTSATGHIPKVVVEVLAGPCYCRYLIYRENRDYIKMYWTVQKISCDEEWVWPGTNICEAGVVLGIKGQWGGQFSIWLILCHLSVPSVDRKFL